MLKRPCFKPNMLVETVEGEGLVLLSEQGHAILEGRLFELVASLIDGQRSVDEIAAQLGDRAAPDEVRDAVRHLEQRGYLVESNGSVPHDEAVFWAAHGLDAHAALHRLEGTCVAVQACSGIAVEPFVRVLQSLRVQVADPAALAVVLTDNYLRPELEAYNHHALEREQAWMLVKPVGHELWLGPIFRPGQTGCWECLARRLRANREVESFLQARKGSVEPYSLPHSSSPATLQIAYSLAAMEVARWIARGGDSELEGRVRTLDLQSWKAQTHTLVWQIQCPACGDAIDPEEHPVLPVRFQSQKKSRARDTGHRVLSPELTLERFEHQVSPITGAVTRLERSGGGRNGVLHAYSASHNSAVPRRNLKSLQSGLRSRSGGKGVNDVQARASGLCEALERYSAVYRGEEPRRRARMAALGEAAIHPNKCMLFSERQYQERELWNARRSRFNIVPLPFDEAAEIDWTPVWSLTRQEPRYLPTAFCYFRYPYPRGEAYCIACSNGSAAGNTLEEAALHGFLELVERDSVALWWYNRVRRPAVALDSFDDPYLPQLAEYLRAHHRELWVLDLTADLQIPAFAALSRRVDRDTEQQILIGFGAHLDPRIAVLRAVTEMNQSLLRLLQIPDEDSSCGELDLDNEVGRWLKTATLENQPYLVPDPAVPPRTPADYPCLWTDDLRDDLLICQQIVEQRGMEVMILDQTRPDIGLPVVKVIVPGLRHFWARYGPGRLYDVPVKLGWLPRPLDEEQLNPIPIFI